MENLTVRELQAYLSQKYSGKANNTALFMKLVEEMGEVAEKLNELEGRKKEDASNTLEEELVDVIHYTIGLAAINNIDITKAIFKKDKIASKKYGQPLDLESFLSKK